MNSGSSSLARSSANSSPVTYPPIINASRSCSKFARLSEAQRILRDTSKVAPLPAHSPIPAPAFGRGRGGPSAFQGPDHRAIGRMPFDSSTETRLASAMDRKREIARFRCGGDCAIDSPAALLFGAYDFNRVATARTATHCSMSWRGDKYEWEARQKVCNAQICFWDNYWP